MPFDRNLIWLLWLFYGLDLTDLTEWGRARLAWEYGLSREEVHLVELIAAGLTNGQIAEVLDLAEENTVKNRIRFVLKKMNVDSRVRVATAAVYFGLGRGPDKPNE